jgi:hypothetical protein
MDKPTKVELLNDIPFTSENGLTTGKVVNVVEVPRLLTKPMGEEIWVRGDDGEDYRIFPHEWKEAVG